MKSFQAKAKSGRAARLSSMTGGGPADNAAADPLGTPSDLSAGGGSGAGYKKGGRVKSYADGGAIDGGSPKPRMDRKGGGKKDAKTNVNVIIAGGAPGGGAGAGGPPPPGVMGAGPPPMPPPGGPMKSGGRVRMRRGGAC